MHHTLPSPPFLTARPPVRKLCHSDLRNAWDVIDGFIIVTSLLAIIFAGSDLSVFKSMRLVRALRPLRVIRRCNTRGAGCVCMFARSCMRVRVRVSAWERVTALQGPQCK